MSTIQLLKRSKKIIAELGGNIEKTFTYKLIKEESLRNIILIKKIKKTPDVDYLIIVCNQLI